MFVIKLENKHTKSVLKNSTSKYDKTTSESSCFNTKDNDLALQHLG